MAGHNKWSKIKRKKGVNDARRSKIWTKIIKEISIAVRESGPDPDSNPRLRLALTNAKGVNMPKDNIQRAINKAGEAGGTHYAEVTYEGYGPGGVAVFVECTTDNLNRTVANIRMYFSKYGGSLGTNGSLSFVFERKGVFEVPKGALNEESFTMEMIDAGAEDVELDDNLFTVTCAFEDFGTMQKKLEALGIEAENAELRRIPRSFTAVDTETGKKALRLIEALEDDDDVQAVYQNMELTEELAGMV
jgi:YebC/PmpR family DNA-binding regulatory protein